MEIVLSGENRYDQWDNFFFKDKAGKEHKVGAKNRKGVELASVVADNPNRAVILTYDTIKGKDGKDYDYISGIKLLDILVDETKITEQQVVPPQPAQQKADPKNRAFALSYAKDIGCARIQVGGRITSTEILNIAALFTSYLDVGYSQEALKIYIQTQKELKKEE